MRVLTAALLLATACAPTTDDVAVSGPPTVAPMTAHPPVPWPTTTTTTAPATTTTEAPVAVEVAPQSNVTVRTTVVTVPRSSECGGWRPLIENLWPAWAVDGACSVLLCESEGNPSALNASSGAAGLFQVMPFWADDYQRVTGQPYYDGRFDAGANATFAAWLWGQTQTWSHWSCKP